jgi:two-component system nitrogen regulation response regulator GlnG
VLILGESGTGKELVARAIYHYSRRSQKPFLAINCAALPETLLESELFGHEAGAFTGADQRRIGKFEQVSGGTIFLDEIGDMSLTTQAKALRLIQEQAFQRLGGTQTVQTNVRIIAATNHNLPKLIDSGLFRLDLYYRLNVFTIALPPLRERREDLPLLMEHFLKKFNQDSKRRVRTWTGETLRILQAYDWPGNVRELESAMRFAMARSTGEVITPDCLPLACIQGAGHAPIESVSRPAASAPPGFDLQEHIRQLLDAETPDLYRQLTETVDRLLLTEVMQRVDGNQVQACRKLGIARMTLRNKLRTLDMLGGDSAPDHEAQS